MLNSFSVSTDVHVQAASVRLFFCWAFATSYFAMVIMISPLILKEVVGADSAAVWQGTLTSITAGSGLILCSILGYLSDRFGRLLFIRIWAVCFLIASVGVIHAEMSKTLGGLLMARTVPFSVASALTYALASDIARDSAEVLKSHAALGATFSTAMLFGNVIAAGLGMFFPRMYVLMVGTVLVLVSTYLAFNSLVLIQHHNKDVGVVSPPTQSSSMNENAASDEKQHLITDAEGVPIPSSPTNNMINSSLPAKKDISWWAALSLLRKDPLLRNLVLAYALLRCANVNSFSVFVLFVDEKFKWTLQHMAAFLCLTGLIGAVMQVLLVRWMNSYLTKFSPLEGGAKVIKLFFALLSVAPILCFCYGFAPSGFWMFFVTIPGGIVAVVPALFTSKIASLSKEAGLTGFSLGLVGSLQNFIESFLGILWGKMLAYAIRNFEPSSPYFGLPYYVNAGVYFLVFVIVFYSHHKHGVGRKLWMENEGALKNSKDAAENGGSEGGDSMQNKKEMNSSSSSTTTASVPISSSIRRIDSYPLSTNNASE